MFKTILTGVYSCRYICSMIENIEEGDYVRHTTSLVNGGLQMSVLKVEGDKALCGHFAGVQLIDTEDWFPLKDLVIVSKGNGGFRD